MPIHTLLTNDWIGPWIKINTVDNFTALEILSLDDPKQQGIRIEQMLFDELDVRRTSLFDDSIHHNPRLHEPFDVTATNYQPDHFLREYVLVANEAFADFKTITNKHKDYHKVLRSYQAQLVQDNTPCILQFTVTDKQFRSCPEFWIVSLIECNNSFHLIIRKHRHFSALSRYDTNNPNVTNMGKLRRDGNGLFANQQHF